MEIDLLPYSEFVLLWTELMEARPTAVEQHAKMRVDKRVYARVFPDFVDASRNCHPAG